jgi:hypothetical protein
LSRPEIGAVDPGIDAIRSTELHAMIAPSNITISLIVATYPFSGTSQEANSHQ